MLEGVTVLVKGDGVVAGNDGNYHASLQLTRTHLAVFKGHTFCFINCYTYILVN